MTEPISTVAWTIANGGSLSGAIDCKGPQPVGVAMPAAWTAATITLQMSPDGGTTWYEVYDTDGVLYNPAADAGRYIPLSPPVIAGATLIKVRSGTAAAPVAQGAARSGSVVRRAV